MRFAHIINPVIVKPSSDLYRAQPITFASMQTAREYAQSQGVMVDIYTAQYPEDRGLVPPEFTMTPDLEQSVLDYGRFRVPRRLPLIRDILDRLYQAAEDADYLIYTNVDIALVPHFYLTVAALIEQGYDAFTINRRSIPKLWTDVSHLPLMSAQVGAVHKGHDCFVFPRSAYPHYYLPNLCLGAFRVGMGVLVNLIYQADNFELFRDLHLTYHLGNDRAHRLQMFDDYKAYNEAEFRKLLEHYDIVKNPREHYMIQRLANDYAPETIIKKIRKAISWRVQKVQRVATAWKQDDEG